jgi:hypothetical protein
VKAIAITALLMTACDEEETAATSDTPSSPPDVVADPVETADPPEEAEPTVQETEWCRRLKASEEERAEAVWVLRSADVDESDVESRDTLTCGEPAATSATEILDLVRESDVTAVSEPVIGDISVFCELAGEAHTRVRAYHAHRPAGTDADPAEARKQLWGVVVLAALDETGMPAQTERMDGLVQRIRERGCEAVAQELAR